MSQHYTPPWKKRLEKGIKNTREEIRILTHHRKQEIPNKKDQKKRAVMLSKYIYETNRNESGIIDYLNKS